MSHNDIISSRSLPLPLPTCGMVNSKFKQYNYSLNLLTAYNYVAALRSTDQLRFYDKFTGMYLVEICTHQNDWYLHSLIHPYYKDTSPELINYSSLKEEQMIYQLVLTDFNLVMAS